MIQTLVAEEDALNKRIANNLSKINVEAAL